MKGSLCGLLGIDLHLVPACSWTEEMKQYETSPPPPLPVLTEAEKKRKRRAKSPSAPKKPRTAYILFTMEHRCEDVQMSPPFFESLNLSM